MTVVNPKSISGINSITTGSGSDNLLTIHTNDGTERVRVDSTGTTKIVTGIVTTLTATTGIVTTLTTNTAKVGTGITLSPDGDVFTTGITTSSSVIVGGGVTISESGIEASGIGITVANINDGQIGGRRNMVTNGGMAISQRVGTAASTPVHEEFVLDRWENHLSQTGKFSVQQVEDAPNGEGVGKYSSKITSLSAYTIQTGDYFVYNQNIEGLDVDHLQFGTSSAKTITISFYVKSSLTGTFSLAVRNSAYNRSQVQEYSISSANTWERKSLTFAGDTSGTWLTTNGVGVRLSWGLGGGSTYHIASTGTWLGVDDWTTSSSTSVVSTNAATWYITGVQLEVGDQATTFEHRSYNEEFTLCQRYYQKHKYGSYIGVNFLGRKSGSNTVVGVMMGFPPMRASASGTFTGAFKLYRITDGSTHSSTSVTVGQPSNYGHNTIKITAECTGSFSTGNMAMLYTGANGGTIELDAEP